MKESVCRSKKCQLHFQHKENKQLVCIVGRDKDRVYFKPVVKVGVMECMSKRSTVRTMVKRDEKGDKKQEQKLIENQ